MDSGVLRVGILLDGVTAIGLNSDFAMFFDLGNFTTRVSGPPFPGDCRNVITSASPFKDIATLVKRNGAPMGIIICLNAPGYAR
jgi:hypothetical protein